MRDRLVLLVFACIFAGTGAAQTNTGLITGQVLDAQQAAIAGAEVVLTEETTGVHTVAKTEANGIFIYPSVQPGKYRIAGQASGFKRLEKRDVTLSSTERLSVGNLILELGSVNESVTVTGE